ncbi:hypothetical protein ASV53_24440 [Photobacterium sanguinicancri]|uniref:Glycosyl transferase family 1 domain-containing protein n=1 Tax=Photobacterium sanguinicancri TaxID=875932 RepID=A0ABX4FR67_9GAMM|nr:hypothetical protein ASV53_24440 [Photobacterium sanguinicancri]
MYPLANEVVLDNLDREQIKSVLANSRLMLLTSDREGSPQVFKEAMAAGLPVLSRNVGDVSVTSQYSPNAYVSNDEEFLDTALGILEKKERVSFDKSLLFNNLAVSSVCAKILEISHEC